MLFTVRSQDAGPLAHSRSDHASHEATKDDTEERGGGEAHLPFCGYDVVSGVEIAVIHTELWYRKDDLCLSQNRFNWVAVGI